ncbi:hypothetical protein [Halalkalibacter oceani]|uniref:hypothetical protein n=1 Tax=Halalkalibacter oceani TaxID=1653776 RepID=UPI003396396E
MSEKDVSIDAHFTASAMANENFNSSENMKSKQVKKLHLAMALQQATISEMYEDDGLNESAQCFCYRTDFRDHAFKYNPTPWNNK